jgi:tetratricopeptide (TPR) repeat protein
LRKAIKESEDIEVYNLFFQGEIAGYLEKSHEKQEKLFRDAVRKRTRDYFLLRNLGVSLSKQDREDEAIEWYNKALTVNPNDYSSLRSIGVSLSKQGKEDEAIEWFKKALAVKPKDYHSFRLMGVSLSKQGKEDEAIEWFKKALTVNPNDYHSFRLTGVSLSKQGKEDEAIEWYNKALTVNPNDYSSLRSIGVSLSKQGKEDEAIEWFKKALAVKPEDYVSLKGIGVALSKQGKGEEAIEWFKKALAVNPEDYDSLRGIGVALSKQGKEEEAIEWFKKVLAVNLNDYHSYRAWSVSAFNTGDHETALQQIKEAYKRHPEDKSLLDDLRFVCSASGVDVNAVLKEITEGERQAVEAVEKKVTDVKTLLYKLVKERFKDRIDGFSAQKKKAEKYFDIFLSNESCLRDNLTLLFVLRKWNSYTPAIPLKGEERRLGGGYFIWHNGKGTVIDPGYNFIENFSNAGCRLVNVDRIVITHAHNDHTDDFEALLNLIHEFNERHKRKERKIDIYLNLGSFKKFSGFLDLKKCDYIHKVYPLSANNTYDLGDGMTITALPAYHDEVITEEYAVGVYISINTDKGERKIILTSDTGLYPQIRDDKDEKVADIQGTEIHRLYREVNEDILQDVSILISHLGSIKEEEIRQPDPLSLYFYPNHLGVQGTVQMITAVHPRLAIVSEFGEELRGFRQELMYSIRDVIREFFKGEDQIPNVIPGDLPLICDIENEAVFCHASKQLKPYDDVDYKLDPSDTFYYFASKERSKFEATMGYFVEDFENKRKNAKELFCFKD